MDFHKLVEDSMVDEWRLKLAKPGTYANSHQLGLFMTSTQRVSQILDASPAYGFRTGKAYCTLFRWEHIHL